MSTANDSFEADGYFPRTVEELDPLVARQRVHLHILGGTLERLLFGDGEKPAFADRMRHPEVRALLEAIVARRGDAKRYPLRIPTEPRSCVQVTITYKDVRVLCEMGYLWDWGLRTMTIVLEPEKL